MSRVEVSRRIAFIAIAVLLVASATGCEPVVNAPPGGGETVTQTFRYGPFTLGPDGEVTGLAIVWDAAARRFLRAEGRDLRRGR